MRQKVGVVIWAIDPENSLRFLMRHNRPFDGYVDEWTIAFGNVEDGETSRETAIREIKEELGIDEFSECKDLSYSIVFDSSKGKTKIHFFAIKMNTIDVPVRLNEESIGYDWMKFNDAIKIMKYEDEKESLEIVKREFEKLAKG